LGSAVASLDDDGNGPRHGGRPQFLTNKQSKTQTTQ